eukprot:scaffold421515_cov20-Prasinocladus_malaysianus.AAC.1
MPPVNLVKWQFANCSLPPRLQRQLQLLQRQYILSVMFKEESLPLDKLKVCLDVKSYSECQP